MPIRVLWVIKGLGPGGAERLLVDLSAAHDRTVVEPEAAYLIAAKDALVPEMEAQGVRVRLAGGSNPAAWTRALRRLLADGGYDVVHAHLPLAALSARLATRSLPRRRRPVLVSTEHNAWSTYAPPTRLLNAATAPLDSAVVAVSEEVRRSIWLPSVRRRCQVVIHGVAPERIQRYAGSRDAVRAELGIGPDEVMVATIANYRPQKAYPDLLEAARQAVDAGVAIRFVTVGQGPLEAEIRSLHDRLGLGDRLLLLGHRPDAVRILAAADIFTLASHYEGFPVALMEARALGLPVVATAVGGVAEAVQSGVDGELVPPGRPDRLAVALTAVAGDRARLDLLTEGARKQARTFDISNAARALEQLYADVAP